MNKITSEVKKNIESTEIKNISNYLRLAILATLMTILSSTKINANQKDYLAEVNNGDEKLTLPENVKTKIISEKNKLSEKYNELLKSCSEEHFIYNALGRYWKNTNDSYQNFTTSVRDVINKRYQSNANFNATNQMLSDLNLTPERYEKVYPHARNVLVDKYGYQGENPTDKEELETYFPEKFSPIQSPDQVFQVGMFTCQGDDKDLKKDQLEIAINFLGKEEFSKAAKIKVNIQGISKLIKFDISHDGIENVSFADSDEEVPPYIVKALKESVEKPQIVKKDKYDSDQIAKLDQMKGSLFTALSPYLKDLSPNKFQKLIPQVLAKKDLKTVREFAYNLSSDDPEMVTHSLIDFVLKYKPDIAVDNDKATSSADDPENNDSLFKELLRERNELTDISFLPNQYGMKARIKELKQGQISDIRTIVEKIHKRNPDVLYSDIYMKCLAFKKAHQEWDKVHGLEYRIRLAENIKKTRNSIHDVLERKV